MRWHFSVKFYMYCCVYCFALGEVMFRLYSLTFAWHMFKIAFWKLKCFLSSLNIRDYHYHYLAIYVSFCWRSDAYAALKLYLDSKHPKIMPRNEMWKAGAIKVLSGIKEVLYNTLRRYYYGFKFFWSFSNDLKVLSSAWYEILND